ncbi:hypothetical protein [Anaerotignum sp.]|uniref:hypothetical protein n=1 Tax=Anaerotignum sp. TaxID=2039241 RepID=UPI0028AA5A01|nr:hypothetical protein [Anaerotignum sp.]
MKVIGVNNADFHETNPNPIRDRTRPDVSMFTNIKLLQEDKKFFLKLTVSQGTKKPYFYQIRELDQQVNMLEREQHLPQFLKM